MKKIVHGSELVFLAEEPVERSFGMEVLGHSKGDDINMEFISISGSAPLTLRS